MSFDGAVTPITYNQHEKKNSRKILHDEYAFMCRIKVILLYKPRYAARE
jgi:hypothetical protein